MGRFTDELEKELKGVSPSDYIHNQMKGSGPEVKAGKTMYRTFFYPGKMRLEFLAIPEGFDEKTLATSPEKVPEGCRVLMALDLGADEAVDMALGILMSARQAQRLAK